MAKTNFRKVEEALDEGLEKMKVKKLLDEADKAKGKSTEKVVEPEEQNKVLLVLKEELFSLAKRNRTVYKKAGTNKKKLKTLLSHGMKLTPEEWQQVQKIRDKVESYRKEIAEKATEESNIDLIEAERHKHINKRFDVNEGWLPLD